MGDGGDLGSLLASLLGGRDGVRAGDAAEAGDGEDVGQIGVAVDELGEEAVDLEADDPIGSAVQEDVDIVDGIVD